MKNFNGALHKKFATFNEAAQWIGLKDSGNAAAGAGVNGSPPKTAKTKPYQPTATTATKGRIVRDDDVIDETGWDVVYTDGSCTNNGGEGAKAGIGVWWGHEDPRYVTSVIDLPDNDND